MDKKILLFVVNDPGFFLSHRLPLAVAARNDGFNVHVATMGGIGAESIEKLGYPHHVIPLSRSGLNPIIELIAFWSIWRLFRQLRPQLVHLVTIKPVIYGGISARIVKIPGVISAISGLGFLFVKTGSLRKRVLRHMVLFLYRLAMGHPNQRVIFQNSKDMEELVDAGCVLRDKSDLIRGSGVDLEEYSAKPDPVGIPVIVMASRLLKNKGVNEFVEAARILQSDAIKARFLLVGEPDSGNPESTSIESICALQKEGAVECLGYRTDISELFSKAHIVALPSYYGEGLPKVLVEAAACGRAVVTTDHPGCRDAIDPNVTGLLVPVRDADALASAIQRLIEDAELRQRMGIEGRRLAEKEYSIEKIVQAHLKIYQTLEEQE
ncbi:glycosyltransferase family 4 protein [Motiliproteus sp. MSK22-1]|uniref:glycosyltransferase family 4 protein n=1 Tax=Motiliproteus sp. MSK22-1 TaxID=1897630 RepID=UPI000978B906|nr:glycosyltransferase family 4 protein [Motiliproteus sp. MSK22-1]OMH30899.1 glycosyl transferase family 1 [Motiliproteus sp. MSK22-1]